MDYETVLPLKTVNDIIKEQKEKVAGHGLMKD